MQRTLPSGQEHVPWSLTSLILIVARLCEPSSELYIAEHFYRHSAPADLLGVPLDKVDDNRLYRGLEEYRDAMDEWASWQAVVDLVMKFVNLPGHFADAAAELGSQLPSQPAHASTRELSEELLAFVSAESTKAKTGERLRDALDIARGTS